MELISQGQFYATGTAMQMCWCAVALCLCWCAAASDIYECPAKHSPDFKFSVTSRRNKTGHWIAQVRRNYTTGSNLNILQPYKTLLVRRLSSRNVLPV
jgi:hypothetical protein